MKAWIDKPILKSTTASPVKAESPSQEKSISVCDIPSPTSGVKKYSAQFSKPQAKPIRPDRTAKIDTIFIPEYFYRLILINKTIVF